jgi:hypothetical protein
MHNKKYIMIGTPIITKEIFRTILRPLNTYEFKPTGGFWASNHIHNAFVISDWFTYLTKEAPSIAKYKDLNNGVTFSLKDSAKILTINSPNQVLELFSKYPSYHHTLNFNSEITNKTSAFDYEKLSQYYDGIYVDYNCFKYKYETNVFNTFSCNSLLLFNLDCIKEYQTVQIIFDIDNPYSIPYINEKTISEPKIIEEESYEHKMLTIITKELFQDIISNYDNYTFIDYDDYFTNIIESTKKVIEILMKNEQNKIIQIQETLNKSSLKVDERLIAQNIVLHYLSNYLNTDIERIKTLPKTKIRKTKCYPLY